jgi:FlaA1/EpsC-like NDP-sugar epimerase
MHLSIIAKIAAKIPNSRLYFMIFIESVIFVMAVTGAYLLRFEFELDHQSFRQLVVLLPFLIPSKLAVFYLFGLFRGMWRYSGIQDSWRLAQACLVSSLLLVAALVFTNQFTGYSRAIFLLDGILTFLLTGGLRMGIRSYYAVRTNHRGSQVFCLPHFADRSNNSKRILIIGAGGSGEKLLRETFDSPHLSYKVVGFLDDDPAKQGRAIHGVPVFGGVDLLPRVLAKHSIDEIVISMPSATGIQMRRVVEICKGCNVPYKTLPAIGQLLDGQVSIKTLRDVNYEDLLRRAPVQLDMDGIRDYLTGKRVMVTGAGGSIGSELCRQLVRFDPAQLILVDAGESNLFNIQMELRHEIGFHSNCCILTRVQNESLMEEVFRNHRPEIVFHAAAYKHVPLLERNPWEAVFNNVLGSRVVMEMAAKFGTSRFVLVSTDKAVRPTNVMGSSKRLAELVLKSMPPSRTRFMAVRFGNVVGSSGSVIPLFRRQIENGGPLTVTHPEVTRYFMTIPEAARLILQAGAFGNGGEIFVLEMGTPVKIAEIAEDLIRLSGKEPGEDIEIVYTGLRAGEKLYEELVTGNEDVLETRHEKIMILQTNGRWNWHGMGSRELFRKWLDGELAGLYRIARSHDAQAIKRKLQQMLPTYTPQSSEAVIKVTETGAESESAISSEPTATCGTRTIQ